MNKLEDGTVVWRTQTKLGCYGVTVKQFNKNNRTFNQFRFAAFLRRFDDSFQTREKVPYDGTKRERWEKYTWTRWNQAQIAQFNIHTRKQAAPHNDRLKEQVHAGCTIGDLLKKYGHPDVCVDRGRPVPSMKKLGIPVLQARFLHAPDGNEVYIVIQAPNAFYVINYAGS